MSQKKPTKYIFITGGIASSLGKGVSASSLGSLLELQGFKIAFQKMDPYLNVDAGTMSPYQHGEVFVTKDGAETDLDLGNYERFTNFSITQESSVTTGKVYQEVIRKERAGDYLGKTVQVIPHITDEIKHRIRNLAIQTECDILIVEIGGTVGDIESFPYLEAIRQFKQEVEPDSTLYIHLTLVPTLGSHGELKTKLTQHSVRELRAIGILPDIILCRASQHLTQEAKEKIALFCNVKIEDVVEALNASVSIYEIPITYHGAGLDGIVLKKLNLTPQKKLDLNQWEKIIYILKNPLKEVHIGVIGKYMQFEDTYKSLYEAITHGGLANNVKVIAHKIESDDAPLSHLKDLTGILIPGGFGERGVEGMIDVIHFARTNKLPLFGICYGMQLISIEYARHVLGLKDTNTQENEPDTKNPLITLMEEQKKQHNMGGTMRLGLQEAKLKEGTLIHSLYGSTSIKERHRHRFEFNNSYISAMEEKGFVISGLYGNFLVETIEIKDHPWAIGVQYHPELQSKPYDPHPLFGGFIKACL